VAGVTQDPKVWSRLGRAFRRSREFNGYSRRTLAGMANVSEKSIQVAEEGRVPKGRMPQSLERIAEALTWPEGSVQMILSGISPESILNHPSLGKPKLPNVADVAEEPEIPRLGFRDIELAESSNLAQDVFVRQVRRFRKMKGISLQQVAQRVAEAQGAVPPGGALGVAELERIENGTRLLKGAEGEAIAYALGTTVGWLLESAFGEDAPDELKGPPTDEELQAEGKAIEQRIMSAGTRVNLASNQYSQARQRAEQARHDESLALAILENARMEQLRLEKQYQYIVGRIDSIRAAKGQSLLFDVQPVYDDEED